MHKIPHTKYKSPLNSLYLFLIFFSLCRFLMSFPIQIYIIFTSHKFTLVLGFTWTHFPVFIFPFKLGPLHTDTNISTTSFPHQRHSIIQNILSTGHISTICFSLQIFRLQTLSLHTNTFLLFHFPFMSHYTTSHPFIFTPCLSLPITSTPYHISPVAHTSSELM